MWPVVRVVGCAPLVVASVHHGADVVANRLKNGRCRELQGGTAPVIIGPLLTIMIESNHKEPQPNTEQVQEELSRVLRSAPFHASSQCRDMLKYLVEHSSEEHEEVLKERTIGIEVFGRRPDYNTAEDAVVRNRMGEIRKRLAQYYQSEEARDSAVQIAIPYGGYRATFIAYPGGIGASTESSTEIHPKTGSFYVMEKHPEAAPGVSSDPGDIGRRSRAARWRIWGIAAAACAVLLVAWIGIERSTKSEFDLFWGPIFESNKPVIIYAGTIPAYLPSTSLANKLASQSAGGHELPAEVITLPTLAEGDVLTAKDVVAYRNGLASNGDIAADVMVAALLSVHHRGVEFHAGPDLSFVSSNLRYSPTVLIGAISNYLTLYISRDLPFYFDHDWEIRERGGQGRTWRTAAFTAHPTGLNSLAVTPPNAGLTNASGPVQSANLSFPNGFGADSTATEDYAIVSRLFDSKTGGPVVIIAGLQSCGNQAAAEFLTDPVQMKKLGSISRDALEHKNLELVLHTNLINGAPASVDIIAERSW